MKAITITLILFSTSIFHSLAQERLLKQDASVVEIKMFIKQVLDSPLPTDYIVPKYILSADSPEEATEAVNANYPQFVGKDGEEFLQAIANDPVSYVRLMDECKAVRLYFREKIRRRNAE